MKRILVTSSFQKQLKKFRRYLKEKDIVLDIKQFIQKSIAKGETYLSSYTVFSIELEMIKLRVCVYQVNFRYLVGVIEETDYRPIIIDLKKGKYGQNLSFQADKQITDVIHSAIFSVMTDYLAHTEKKPRLVAYEQTS